MSAAAAAIAHRAPRDCHRASLAVPSRMIKATVGFGAALVLLGVLAYIISGAASVTALIPAFIGGIVLALGLLARQAPGAMKAAVIAAVVLAILAVFGSIRGVAGFVALIGGGTVERPVAAVAQTFTLLLSLAYLSVVARLAMARRTPPQAATR
jgi:hypothetical protein